MIITIGKAQDNQVVTDNPHVSRYHAKLIREEDGSLLLEDCGSTNGTFVNGSQIQKKRVSIHDTILLGDSYQLEIATLLKDTNDYSEEFAQLKVVYDNYIKEKVQIQSSNQFKTRLFQSIPFALLGVIGITVGLLGKGDPSLMIPSLIIAICAPTIGVYLGAKQASKTPHLLQDLVNRFKINYVCPKCGIFLGEIPWESLQNRKQCSVSSCRAKWTKE